MDGGNLAPSLQRRCLSAPYPLFNIGTESPGKQVCANDGNLAPPQTEQLSMLKKGGVGTRRRVIQDAFYVGGARFPPSTDWMYLAKTYRQRARVSYMLIERQTRRARTFYPCLSVARTFCNPLGPCASLDVSDPHYSLPKARNPHFPPTFSANT